MGDGSKCSDPLVQADAPVVSWPKLFADLQPAVVGQAGL